MSRTVIYVLLSVRLRGLRMLKVTLLFLTLSGLQAAPVSVLRGLPKTSSTHRLPDGFRQGTEASRRFLLDLNTGLVQDHISEMERRAFIRPSLGNGLGEMARKHWLAEEVPVDVPAQMTGSGWVRVEDPASPRLPDGFRQGTEPSHHIPEGFRQGTEPSYHIPEGFRQGTEPSYHIPEGFRQGTEPSYHIPEGFRQGTEPFMSIPDGFRQGTEPIRTIPEGFRQGTEPSTSSLRAQTVACKGEVIDGKCYEFNPTPLAFADAQALCRALAPNAELASITSVDLHSRLVSLVTKGGERSPVLTWLGGTVKNQQASWVDGSEWSYSDWMPGQPNIHTDKPVCVDMFKIDESWWTAADCELQRASVCSYPLAA